MTDTIIDKKWICNNKACFSFVNKDYVVTYDPVKKDIHCTCYNGSNMGLNNVQQCKHKREVLKYINDNDIPIFCKLK